MSDAVKVALITAAGTIIVQLIIGYFQTQKRKDDDAKRDRERADAEAAKERTRAVEEARKDAQFTARFEAIEKTLEDANRKLDIHNGYAEKIGVMQKDISYIKGRMEVLQP